MSEENKCFIVDIAIPGVSTIHEKEFEKNRKISGFEVGDYKNVECKNVDAVPGVVEVLGSVTKKLGQWIEKLRIRVRIGLLQKTTRKATILRKMLDLQVPRECHQGTRGYDSLPWESSELNGE